MDVTRRQRFRRKRTAIGRTPVRAASGEGISRGLSAISGSDRLTNCEILRGEFGSGNCFPHYNTSGLSASEPEDQQGKSRTRTKGIRVADASTEEPPNFTWNPRGCANRKTLHPADLAVGGPGDSAHVAKLGAMRPRTRSGRSLKFRNVARLIRLFPFADAAAQMERANTSLAGGGSRLGAGKSFHDPGQRNGLPAMAAQDAAIALRSRFFGHHHGCSSLLGWVPWGLKNPYRTRLLWRRLGAKPGLS